MDDAQTLESLKKRVLELESADRERQKREAEPKESEARFRILDYSHEEAMGHEHPTLSDILDISAMRPLVARFHALTNLTIAILDKQGNILLQEGFQDICTKFHRAHPASARNCLESDTLLTADINPGEFRLYKCKNQMWDIATPICIHGERLGNVLMGQFFFDDETVDEAVYRKQAREYGYDEADYIACLRQVPRWPRETVYKAMSFFIRLAEMISSQGINAIRLTLALSEKNAALDELRIFKTIADRSNAGMAIASPDGVLSYVNDAMARMHGWETEELVGRHLSVFHHEDQMDRVNRLLRRVLHQGGFTAEEVWHARRGGDAFPTLMNAVRIPDGKGGPLCLSTSAIDITLRMKAVQLLQEKEEQYRELVENVNSIILRLDPAGNVTFINDYAQHFFGYREEEILGRPVVGSIVPKTDASGRDLDAMMRDILRHPERFAVNENENITQNGRRVWIAWSNRALFDAQGNLHEILCVGNDVTERKRLQDALEKRLIALTRPDGDIKGPAFQDMFDIERLQRLQDDFSKTLGVSSIITHPDGTPITRPSGFKRLCRDIIRTTEKGFADCRKADEQLGAMKPDGPLIYPCSNTGLWRAGACIAVQGTHIANWIIGQTRDETRSDESIRRYAGEIGADEEAAAAAFAEIPVMTRERFSDAARLLYNLARQLSDFAWQNVQQARLIAELQEKEAKLRESEKRHRTILRTALDGFWIASALDGRILEANEAYCRISGYDEAELLSLSIKDLEALESAEEVQSHLQTVMERGFDRFETRHRRKDGALVEVEMNVMSLPLFRNQIVAFIRDISAKKKQERELRLKSLVLDQITDLVTVTDLNGVITYVNQASEKTMGMPKSALIGRPISILGEDLAQGASQREILEKTLQNGLWRGEVVNVTQEGSRRIMDCRTRIVYNEKGGAEALCGISTDITAFKHAETLLRQNEEKHRRLFETMSQGVVYHAADGRIISANPSAERILGLTRDELLGKTPIDPIWKAILPDGSPLPGEVHPAMVCLRTGEPVEQFILGVINSKQKDYVWISVNAIPIFHPGQARPHQVYATFEDITQRVLSEKALRESEERFRALHNASFGGIAIHDKGVILECNQGMMEMTGYSQSELKSMDGLLLIAEQDREMVRGNILAGYEKPYEARGRRKNGEEFPMRLEARNIPYKGKQVRTVEFRDLTEIKKSEKEQEKLRAQLLQAQKMESIGRLAGGVAHDFNNMLGIILTNAEAVMEEIPAEGPLHDAVKDIKTAAERSADLTRQLLAFARKQAISPKVLDLNGMVAGMHRMIRRLIGEDIRVDWLPGENLWPVRLDPSQLDQILANLCVNAKDAITGQGLIEIATRNTVIQPEALVHHPDWAAGDHVVLSVSDNGSGMDKALLANIFEPFFTTKEIGKGTGLGLATVYGIVSQNKGFIHVESEPGKGTCFRIYLPRHVESGPAAEEAKPREISCSGRETILLVEDEELFMEVLKTRLEKLGYRVLGASTPGEAVQMARDHAGSIDILITDVVMPEMNGRDLAKTILSLYPCVRRLFMSGYTADVIAHQGVLEEGVHFIQKPFTVKDLAAKIREMVEG